MENMNEEQVRLDTFLGWPVDAPIEASRIAKGGFFATGNGLEVQCNWCGSKIDEWSYGDQVMVKHRRLNADCAFVLNPTNSGNVPISSQPTVSEVVPVDLMNEQCRLSTFRNWPVPFISPQSLAKAGFYYFHLSDHVRCAWCQGIIAKWEVGDNPFTEHLRFFPNCPRAQLGPNVELSSEEPIRSLGIQQIRAPKKERYSSLDARIRSFVAWPLSSIQAPETLASAGFYYQNTDDQVRCFQCNGGLRSWQREDDAWFEHARWFPKCEFVQLVKGQQYITQVQEQSRPTLEEAMAGDTVQKALQMGLNEGRVRAVTKYHLEHFGGPFKCPETLIDAVLEYQREEELQQRHDMGDDDIDDDDDNNQTSSAIVREVGRILDTIFKHSRDSSTLSSSSDASTSRGYDIVPDDGEARFSSEDFVTLEMPTGHDIENEYHSTNTSHNIQHTSNQLPSIEQDNTPIAGSIMFLRPDNFSIVGPVNREVNPVVPENNNDASSEASSPSSSAATTTSRQSSLPSTISKPQKENEKNLSLEEENRQLKDARLCKVCMDDDVAVVFLPCSHLVTCVQCAPSVTACPLCRTAIKAFVRTFLS